MKSAKAKNLFQLAKLGVPVPYFQVIQHGDPLPSFYPNFDYAVRSAPFVSMAGILDSVLNVPVDKVPAAIDKVFASWGSQLAQKYRQLKKMSDDLQMEVIVQAIVSPKSGYAGILHTSNPVTGKKGFTGSFVRNGFADNLCKGIESGEDIKNLHPQLLQEIYIIADTIERYYGFPQDIEFVIDSSEKIWVVQVRDAQLTDYAFFNWCSQVDGGKEIAAKYAHVFDIEKCVELQSGEKPVAVCVGVSGDIVDGEIGHNVLVLDTSNISEFTRIYEVQNIILLNGNIHNHFAVEARKAKKNCVIWPNAPKSGKIWIHVQSGQVFLEKPVGSFENKMKKKFGK